MASPWRAMIRRVGFSPAYFGGSSAWARSE
jgi:hypothetical protein